MSSTWHHPCCPAQKRPSTPEGPSWHQADTQIDALALQVLGFGHVELTNLAIVRARESELMHRLNSQRWPRLPSTQRAGQN